MTKPKADLFDRAMNASAKAPLQHVEPAGKKLKPGRKNSLGDTRRKLVDLPVEFFDRFEALKQNGSYELEFTAFIREAIREKLETLENGNA